jgi:NADPH-dependent 2,4-dienoyl-CoA reductase/sulfur reductase-like enzyme/nitrite reductase/ring-hydroxylating ferredoxin subunit
LRRRASEEDFMGGAVELRGRDLVEQGVPLTDIKDGGMVLGHAAGEAVLVARRGLELYALGATCSHYGAPLSDGILVGDEVRCPMHHACFHLRTGEASAPAFRPVDCWKVERRGDSVFVTEKVGAKSERITANAALPTRVVVVGGGAAGHAAVETLRREGYAGTLTLLTADASAPYDRTNVSKDYLAGNAPEEWMPMRSLESYADDKIDLRTNARVASIDTKGRRVVLENGDGVPFDALLLATGADAIKLSVPGSDLPHVAYVRTLADSRAIIARAATARRAVVIGASFIGLEAAASLRARGLDVHVVAPDPPLSRVLGAEVGAFVRALHEEHGVVFSIGATAAEITPAAVRLTDGTHIDADLVVVGIGVRPSLSLAEKAGLAIDRGVVVNEHMETSVAGVYAAGDIARWPDARTGRTLRVEHWVVAQRQAQVAARAILGQSASYKEVPFFWSQHYDVAINYVGHVEKVDAVQVSGSLRDRSAVVVYREGGRIGAVATVGRDRVSLLAEECLARDDQTGLEALVRGEL